MALLRIDPYSMIAYTPYEVATRVSSTNMQIRMYVRVYELQRDDALTVYSNRSSLGMECEIGVNLGCMQRYGEMRLIGFIMGIGLR